MFSPVFYEVLILSLSAVGIFGWLFNNVFFRGRCGYCIVFPVMALGYFFLIAISNDGQGTSLPDNIPVVPPEQVKNANTQPNIKRTPAQSQPVGLGGKIMIVIALSALALMCCCCQCFPFAIGLIIIMFALFLVPDAPAQPTTIRLQDEEELIRVKEQEMEMRRKERLEKKLKEEALKQAEEEKRKLVEGSEKKGGDEEESSIISNLVPENLLSTLKTKWDEVTSTNNDNKEKEETQKQEDEVKKGEEEVVVLVQPDGTAIESSKETQEKQDAVTLENQEGGTTKNQTQQLALEKEGKQEGKEKTTIEVEPQIVEEVKKKNNDTNEQPIVAPKVIQEAELEKMLKEKDIPMPTADNTGGMSSLWWKFWGLAWWGKLLAFVAMACCCLNPKVCQCCCGLFILLFVFWGIYTYLPPLSKGIGAGATTSIFPDGFGTLVKSWLWSGFLFICYAVSCIIVGTVIALFPTGERVKMFQQPGGVLWPILYNAASVYVTIHLAWYSYTYYYS